MNSYSTRQIRATCRHPAALLGKLPQRRGVSPGVGSSSQSRWGVPSSTAPKHRNHGQLCIPQTQRKREWYQKREVFRTMQPTAAVFTMAPRPAFEDLPLRPGDPKCSAWGLWGNDDTLGTLNLLTPERVQHAARQVVTGETIPLKYVPTPTKTNA